MNVKKMAGLAAVAGLLIIAAPTERAQAMSLSSTAVAATVQNESGKLTTEVRWYHHHWHHHHYWHRHYWHHHHWRHHHWRHW